MSRMEKLRQIPLKRLEKFFDDIYTKAGLLDVLLNFRQSPKDHNNQLAMRRAHRYSSWLCNLCLNEYKKQKGIQEHLRNAVTMKEKWLSGDINDKELYDFQSLLWLGSRKSCPSYLQKVLSTFVMCILPDPRNPYEDYKNGQIVWPELEIQKLKYDELKTREI